MEKQKKINRAPFFSPVAPRFSPQTAPGKAAVENAISPLPVLLLLTKEAIWLTGLH